ncbi:hypothetical protein Taro_017857 [Colocasia esculenta]|uniref:Uncharacterized protein n=1 Tax=Colocasia esculenta TaxID=4460 RepID=A0A843UUJ6_COLES|nr:hypothetical protein [Colocasia esculenta]
MISNARFWEKIFYYLKVIEPLILILRIVDGDDKNDMGYLYEAMDKAKKILREMNPKAYRKWWAIIDKRWEMTLHHNLHVAEFRRSTSQLEPKRKKDKGKKKAKANKERRTEESRRKSQEGAEDSPEESEERHIRQPFS